MLHALHYFISIILTATVFIQANMGWFMAPPQPEPVPTWNGRLPAWASDPQYGRVHTNSYNQATPQLRNASPMQQFMHLAPQVPQDLWGILADTVYDNAPAYLDDDYPLPPPTPQLDPPATSYTLYLPAITLPQPTIWGQKPMLDVFISDPVSLVDTLGFSAAESAIVAAVMQTEQDAITALDAEAALILEDMTLTDDEKRAAIAGMDYNGRLRTILQTSSTTLQTELPAAQYQALVAWLEQSFQDQRKTVSAIRTELNTPTSANQCVDAVVYATTSTYTDISVDLPDVYLKAANRGGTTQPGYENPPYTVNLVYSGTITTSVVVTDVAPWNWNDNYWRAPNDPIQPRRAFTDLPLGMPEAEAAYFNGYNNGLNEFNQIVTNPAGINISQPVAAYLGFIGGTQPITVTFDWDCDAPTRYNRTFGLNSFTSYAAQGINPVTGNQFQWFRDFIVPGQGLNVDMVRYYNAQSTEEGIFGLGWSTIYDMYLKTYANGVVEVRYADGHKGYFTPDGSGGYMAELGVFESLTAVGGGYTLTTRDQLQFNFDSGGTLQTIADSNGNELTLNYSGSTVTEIVDASGRSFTLDYDGFGHVTHIHAPDARVYTYTYGVTSIAVSQRTPIGLNSGGNQLLQMTDARGGSTNFEYDPSGNWMTKATDPAGIDYLNNVYTPDGRVQSQMDANGGSSTFEYDLANLIATETDALGNKTIYYFDSDYRVIKEEDALGQTTTYTYDGDNIASMTDKRGNTWYYTYDERGNMLSQEDPVDAYSALYYTTDVTYYEYDADNNMTKMIDALGYETVYEYDANNNMTKVIEPNGAVTEAEYNADGEVTRLVDAEGRETHYEYDGDGNLVKAIDAYQNETTSTYDANGNQLSQTDAEGRTIRYEYDKNDNMTKMVDALGRETTFEYDGNNWLEKKIDRRGGVWEWEYDDNGNPTLERDPMGNEVTHTYDEMNNRLSTTNARNHTTNFEYDDLYRLVKVIDAKLNETTYTYDPNGNLLTVTDPHHETTSFTYDSANRRKYVYDALGGVTEYCYDPLDRIIRMFDPRRAKTDFFYDSVGNMYEVHDPLANVIHFDYDLVHNRVAVTDPNGHITTYTFDKLNREIEVTNPLSQTMQTGYDKVGNTIVMTDALGYISTYHYNANNWLMTTTNPLGEQATMVYDAEGNRTDFTDENGHTTHYDYNLAGKVTDITDPLTGLTHYDYDPNYNVVLMRNVLNQETTYHYDELDLLAWERDPLAHQTTYSYDALRRMTAVIDAEQNRTEYNYDALGRLIGVTDALSQTTTYEYDPVGNLTTIIDANNIETYFEYNFLNQLRKEINPLENTWLYGYDPAGNMVLRVDGQWQATGYVYDEVNQLASVIYGSTGQRVDYTYDANGNELTMTDWNGTFSYTYDELNRRIGATDHNGRSLQYAYDDVGNRTGMVYPDGRSVTMQYDANNRLQTLTDPQNRDITWEYNELGYITSQINPNGTSTSYTYDDVNRLTELSNDGPAGVIARYSYQMDDVGNRTQVAEVRGSWAQPVTRNYSYDDLYRLTHVQTSNGADTHYAFDPVGNRLQKSGVPETAVGITHTLPVTISYGYNDLNSMLYAGDTTFAYDLNGSRVHKSEPLTATEYISVAAGIGIYTATLETSYVYNYENRLTDVSTYISATDGTTLTLPVMQATYEYDGYGRRIHKHVTTTITRTQILTTPQILTRDYVFDGLDPVAEYEQTQGVITQTVAAFYYRANGRITLQEREENGSTTQSYWYHPDGLTTVIALSDAAGAIQYETQYDEYGNLLDGETASVNRYTYTGQEIDSETGLYHFFARQYEPEVGIWTVQDRFRGTLILNSTLHRYKYATNNSLSFVDEDGYVFIQISGAIASGVAGTIGALRGGQKEIFSQTWGNVKSVVNGDGWQGYDSGKITDSAIDGAVANINVVGNAYNSVVERYGTSRSPVRAVVNTISSFLNPQEEQVGVPDSEWFNDQIPQNLADLQKTHMSSRVDAFLDFYKNIKEDGDWDYKTTRYCDTCKKPAKYVEINGRTTDEAGTANYVYGASMNELGFNENATIMVSDFYHLFSTTKNVLDRQSDKEDKWPKFFAGFSNSFFTGHTDYEDDLEQVRLGHSNEIFQKPE